MPIANPFQAGKLADLSQEINIIPNQWGVIQRLGLFIDDPKTQKTVLVPRTVEEEALIPDRNWDERNNTIKGGERDVLPLVIPHYPVDDAITPNDVDGNVDWGRIMSGGGARAQSVDEVRATKMERLRRAHATTLEYARAQILRDGTVFAPNGTVVTNFYTEFGVTRPVVGFDLNSVTDNPISHPERVLAQIQDSVGGGAIVTNVVALASPDFFNALISNPFVYESYQYFQQSQGPALLNGRLTAGSPLDARFRSFSYGGIDFIEVRGQVGGQPYVNAGEAYAFPLGTDLFRTYYAPANRFKSVNRRALQSYYFEYLNEKDDIIEIMTETNFLNALLRPEAVVTLTVAAD